MTNSQNDVVYFNAMNTGACTLDVQLPNKIKTLELTNWANTLTINNSLYVSGLGDFRLTDGSTISIAAGNFLSLLDLPYGVNFWYNGTITGGGANASFTVAGTDLGISATTGPPVINPGPLGVNLNILKSAVTRNNGFVTIVSMTANLTLSGTDNIIDIQDGGKLSLDQHIAAAGVNNLEGGIAFGPGRNNKVAVKVEKGGTLYRSDSPAAGVPDQVSIAGAVYNVGGTTQVHNGQLNITGKDGNNYSYWQQTDAAAVLQIDASGNINAAGTYEIDIGKVTLTAPSGGSADELDGPGLFFSATNNTALTIVDSGMTPGTVTVQGPVTLATNTTTTMNYMGGNNTSDVLDVQNGTLTLNGFLTLNSSDRKKPTQALIFFDDRGNGAAINGAFTAINGNLTGTYTGKAVTVNGGYITYQVTIT
jgi:hypothetical protein